MTERLSTDRKVYLWWTCVVRHSKLIKSFACIAWRTVVSQANCWLANSTDRSIKLPAALFVQPFRSRPSLIVRQAQQPGIITRRLFVPLRPVRRTFSSQPIDNEPVAVVESERARYQSGWPVNSVVHMVFIAGLKSRSVSDRSAGSSFSFWLTGSWCHSR